MNLESGLSGKLFAMKSCWSCHRLLPLDAFHKASRSSDGHSTQCKECASEYSRHRYEHNRERILEQTKAYQRADPERHRRAQKKAWAKYYARNSEKLKARAHTYYRQRRDAGLIDRTHKNKRDKEWRKKTPEKQREYRRRLKPYMAAYLRQYAATHPETIKKHRRKYRATHIDQCRLYKRLYMARRRRQLVVEGKVTVQQWRQILMFYGRACAYCNKPESDAPLTIDHYIPLAKGGKNIWQNVWPLCLDCNMKKWAKLPPADFRLPHIDALVEIDGKLQLKEKAA